MSHVELIKTVRGLDQSGPGENAETLQLLWSCLAAASDAKYHASEESSLRWLLKSMNGPSEGAEKLRRYPLTWSILDCVFQRIPLFSLAKSLADRKFIAILQQTLQNIAKPANISEKSTSKRKRSTSISYTAETLRSQYGCLKTAEVLFKALKSLLNRLHSAPEQFSRENIGAEHIKSLFCASATDAATIVGPALTICEQFLSSSEYEQIQGCEAWIQTVSSIWDLHLQGADDALTVAIHLFRPASMILARLGAFTSPNQIQIRDNLKQKWTNDIQALMHRNFALPGRAAYVNFRALEAFDTALEICRSTIQLAAPALYFIASSAFQNVAGGGLRKDNVEWIKKTFQVAELAIRERPDRDAAVGSILEQALLHSCPVPVDDLRRICREYALAGEQTKWLLVSKIAQCDSDVFQVSDEGIDLRTDICHRISSQNSPQDDRVSIMTVIAAIQNGFRTRRDLPSFLQLWFAQMSKVEKHKCHENSPWFMLNRHSAPEESLTSILESEMSPSRLNETVAWVKDHVSANPQALSVFAGTIAQAVQSEAFIDTVGRQLFDLVEGLNGSSSFTALRWRVVSQTITWAPPNERRDLWDTVKKPLTKILKKSPFLLAETYEAFKCCYRVWDALSPHEQMLEPAELIEKFIKRLAPEATTSHCPKANGLPPPINMGIDADFCEEQGYHQYIAWIMRGSSRFGRLYMTKVSEIPSILTDMLTFPQSGTVRQATVWEALLGNEVNLNELKLAHELVNRLITVFEESVREQSGPSETRQMFMRTLSKVPLDSYDRNQREKLMSIVFKTLKNNDPDHWKLVLGLVSKVMSRPTFYEGMGFLDLVEASEALSDTLKQSQSSAETILELIDRFFQMTTTVLKQMAEHTDDRSIVYFQAASTFVSDYEKQLADESPLPALHSTLLKVLATELMSSIKPHSNGNLTSLAKQGQQALSKSVISTIGLFFSDTKMFETHNTATDLRILAAIVSAPASLDISSQSVWKASSIRKLEKKIKEDMQKGDLLAWKMLIFLRTYLPNYIGIIEPSMFDELQSLPGGLRESLLRQLVNSVTGGMDSTAKLAYLRQVLDGVKSGCRTDGQFLAIDYLTSQIIESSGFQLQTEKGFDLTVLHGELTALLLQIPANAAIPYRIIRCLLEKRPQLMSQWNIEITLSTVSELASDNLSQDGRSSFSWLCKLVEVIIKKHRLRLEGHSHMLLSTMQILLRNLIITQQSVEAATQEANAHLYARLITLICEPTAGAVSRSQLHSSLDSATDAAKRSAGRHMYLILVHYVKLQLEASVSTEVREVLEPALNTIFGITSPEGRKILNDTMDSNGRAVLREMFKRYVKFGKWSGV